MPYARKYKPSRRGATATRPRRRKTLTKTEKKQVTTIVSRSINKRSENLMNFGRYLYQASGQPLIASNFDGARYWSGNLGGVVPLGGQTFAPMNTIAALAVNSNVSAGLPVYNQTYHGREIYGKYFSSTVTLALPSIDTIAVGGLDWARMPCNFSYRFIAYRNAKRPATGVAASAGAAQTFTLAGFKNEVGSMFGINSDNSEALPDPTGAAQPWCNNDLMTAKINKTNFKVLFEKRGKLSVGTSMNATQNTASVTSGAARYPSEAVFKFSHKIQQKLQLQNTDNTPQNPTSIPFGKITNYDNTIGMFLVLNPLGERAPSGAADWNKLVMPYCHIQNSFTFSDS